jgi:UDP-N-acetylglucosamine kinase
MQHDLIAGLHERFSISPEQIENFKHLSISELTSQLKSSETPKLIIIGGQSGSFKNILQSNAETELLPSAVVLSLDVLRLYHPYINAIRAEYPDMQQSLTADFATKLLENLEDYAIQQKLNVILVVTLANAEAIIEKLTQYKNHGYEIDVRILAINKMFSYLNTEESYEKMLVSGNHGRMISKQQHDKNYDEIPQTLLNLYEGGLLDKVQVYQLETKDENGVIDPQIRILTENIGNFYNSYIQERNRDFTEIETSYLKEKAQEVKAMKIKREANFLEKIRFEFNFKFLLEDKKTSVLRKEKVMN